MFLLWTDEHPRFKTLFLLLPLASVEIVVITDSSSVERGVQSVLCHLLYPSEDHRANYFSGKKCFL